MRGFERHKIREVKSLDGVWDFYPDSGKKFNMPVPGCWESNPNLSNYRGQGTYIKHIAVPERKNIRFVFKGVSHTADVYFNGRQIMHHYNAYTPFECTVPSVAEGEYELKTQVDNTFSENSALHIPNDYYTYGGITRPCAYEFVPDVYIKNVHTTPFKNGDKWLLKTEAELHNVSAEEILCSLKIEAAGKETVIENIEVKDKKTVEWTEEFENITPWCPENPKLYDVKCNLLKDGSVIDDLFDRFGFRTVEICGKDILLNGKKIFLKGFNRHEDYAEFGCAIPLQAMVKDLWIIKDLGCNAVRMSHYPNDERFLDLCDEMGIMVWEENHARGLTLDDMKNKNFEKQCEDCIDEMIYYHYNHPSIIIWGILNECASDTEEGREMYKKQYEQIKKLDTSRPHTSATCQMYKDICLDLPDVVSLNLYSGWYNDDPIEKTFKDVYGWIEKSGGGGKPFIMSEFGAAAMYGFRDSTRRKWSEERQEDILSESLDVYMKNENISGVFIWQFADCRVTEESRFYISRACMRNNKGVVDMYRRPKLSYEVVKEKFSGRGDKE